ncbi:unnamed protein product [Orchesella dallaii]|uniref:Uncharacterized protein n=1 Tax=Orchesella dallaii TaxID=48710 RepID=A0ABP1REZ6_9HEXA
MRQQQLHDFNIFCECDRCTSADELGTHFSTVKCINFEFFDPVKGCMRANLLPVEPCNLETAWRCTSCQCERANKLVQNYMTRITLELEEAKQSVSILKYKELNFAKAKQLADLLGLRKFISVMKQHEGRTVHKNHSIIFHAKCFIIKKLTNGIAEVFSLNVSVKQKIVEFINDAAAYAVKLCDECLAIASILVPGFCYQVGELIYHKQFCLGILLPIEFRKHKQSGGANLMEFFRAFEDAKQLRSKARFILSFYMDNPDVCKMLEFMTLDELLYSTLQKQVDQYSSSSSASSSSSSSTKVPISSPNILWNGGINGLEDVVL